VGIALGAAAASLAAGLIQHEAGFAMSRRRIGRLFAASAVAALGAAVPMRASVAQTVPFDVQHRAWDALLRAHVAWDAQGVATRVSYSGFARDRSALRAVLEGYATLDQPTYQSMDRAHQLAFLINVYNAATIELILTRYPDLKSIRDLGSVVRSPWKRRFITLFGEQMHLDDIEHRLIRQPGIFDEPRIHFVVNCASVGCPALRPEAIVADRLEAQLEDSTQRFLRDTSRNRFNREENRLEISRLFDWYRGDFERGWRGTASREQFLARYASSIARATEDRARIESARVRLTFLDYDWSLNNRL
jgi:hypothetical protein